MKTKFLIILPILFLALISLNFHCGDPVDAKPFDHTFEIPVDIYPLKKVYSLNDTIWLTTDVPTQYLFDTKTNSNVLADSGSISLWVGYNEFGTHITNPPNGFADVITAGGVNLDRINSQWGTTGTAESYGCGRPDYTCRIGFKPLQKGVYSIALPIDQYLESCPAKRVPYYASITYRFKNVDLGLDIFNSLSKNDKGGNDGINYFTTQVRNRTTFIFAVQ